MSDKSPKPAPRLADQVKQWNQEINPMLASMGVDFNSPVPEGPILRALRRERIELLVQSNALNRKLSAIETNIATMERNTDLERQIPEIATMEKVRAILDSLREKEKPGTNHG
jgi:hypothetical protein